MTTFYSDNDPHACAWLRNLMDAGLIPEGHVDERDVRELTAADLAGYGRVSLFAGIGGWERALALAGFDPTRPVWTVSCPCQPFSTAGKGAAEADERHLWPAVAALARECRPVLLFGEQVASRAGYGWLDGVRLDLEKEGYAFGAADLPAACVGAPHKRQRLWWVARLLPDAAGAGCQLGGSAAQSPGRRLAAASGSGGEGVGDAGRVADADGRQPGDRGLQRGRQHGLEQADGSAGLVADADGHGRGGEGLRLPVGQPRRAVPDAAGAGEAGAVGDASSERKRPGAGGAGGDGAGGLGVAGAGQGRDAIDGSETGRLGDADRDGFGEPQHPGAVAGEAGEAPRRQRQPGPDGSERAGADGGFWDDSTLVPCSDGKARRTQPGLQPLVDGLPWLLADGTAGHGSRSKALRGIGNAVVPEVAALFVRAFLDAERDLYHR